MERKEWVYFRGGLLDEVDTGVKLPKFVVAATGVSEDLYAIEAEIRGSEPLPRRRCSRVWVP